VLEARRAPDDQQLVAAFRRGDDHAFEQIFERHRRPLERHARKILGKTSDQAEDVVQEAMLRASRALRRDERHIELRPWLYRLVRNCALDELARVRTDGVILEDAEERGALRAPDATEPEVATERRGRIRDVLGDLAALPEHQRHALLRRELDGVSHAALAVELGTTPQATKMLVHRARTNLVKQDEARSTDCMAVRAALLEAHDLGRRASAATYRHLATCGECRAFRSGLRDTRKAAAILVPAPLVLGAIGLIVGKGAVAGGKGALAKTGATVAAGAAVTAGAVGIGVEVFDRGDPAPQSAVSRALPEGRIAAGQAVPAGTAIVRRTVAVPAGRDKRAMTVELACPPSLRVADLIASAGTTATYAPGTVVGSSTRASVLVEPRPGAKLARLTMLCKAPDTTGSIVAGGARAGAASGALLRVKVRSELLVAPGGAAVGSVRVGQPVRALPATGRARPGWRRIRTDTGETGWVRERTLEPAGP
jgi:RNA polymerase sigma factor (sigma-70 family)